MLSEGFRTGTALVNPRLEGLGFHPNLSPDSDAGKQSLTDDFIDTPFTEAENLSDFWYC